MKLPQIKRILREDLKEAPDWISGIIDPVNSFMQAVYQALNHNISLSENIASFVKEMNYSTTASYPVTEIVAFQSQLKVKPSGVQLLQVYERSTYLPPPGPVYVPWIEVNGEIRIYALTGLEASKTYVLRLVVF